MKSRVQRTVIFIAAMWILMNGAATLTFAQQYHQYEDAHLAVQKTVDDLYWVINQDPERDSGQWRARINRAQKSLSDFDRDLSKGKFNKRRLKSAIASVQNVLKNEIVGRIQRDSLNADVDNLSRLDAVPGK